MDLYRICFSDDPMQLANQVAESKKSGFKCVGGICVTVIPGAVIGSFSVMHFQALEKDASQDKLVIQ